MNISKAFDRVNHKALLEYMHEKGIPENVIKVFVNWWGKFSSTAIWNGCLPKPFPMGSGVPQGSLLRGKLFNKLGLIDCVLNV